METFTVYLVKMTLLRINYKPFIFWWFVVKTEVQLTGPTSGNGSISSTPSAYTWMSARRSLFCTASYRSIILAAADVHVFLANLWSTYLAVMNSFLTVLGNITLVCEKCVFQEDRVERGL